MRTFTLLLALLVCAVASAQSPQANFDSARSSLLRRDARTALPYFQKIMAGGDSVTKRRAIDFLTARWVSIDGGIALSNVVKEYAILVNAYLSDNFVGKDQYMKAADKYTAGMIFWALAYSGSVTSYRTAMNLLFNADKEGDPRAIVHLADAANAYRALDKTVAWEDIVDLYTRASVATKSPQPLLKLAGYALVAYDRFKNSSRAEADTMIRLYFSTLQSQMANMPDSFHIAINHVWRHASVFGEQDTALTKLVSGFIQAAPRPPATAPAAKGYTWHFLYNYFYDYGYKRADTRDRIMRYLKAYYNNDALLMSTIVDFIREAQPSNAGYILAVDSKWLTYFTPSELADSKRFFRSVAASGEDPLPFLAKNKKTADVAEALGLGYTDRFNILTDIMADKQLSSEARFAVPQYAASTHLAEIKGLREIPEFKNNRFLKFALADMSVLRNMAEYLQQGNIPMELDRLAEVFADWNNSDKIIYDKQYLTFFVNDLQKTIDARKKAIELAKAQGRPALDFNDYNKAQQIINKIKTTMQIS